MIRVVVPPLALLLLQASLAAQAPQTPVFRGGVEVVEVDVTVVDARGRQITDMRGPEFAVTIDGRPRKIVTADYVPLRPAGRAAFGGTSGDQPPPEAEGFSTNASSPRGRLILLAVDSANITFGEGSQVLRAAGQFLDKLGPNDKVALITVPQREPSIDFTSDRRRLRAALDRAIGQAQALPQRLNIGGSEAIAIDDHSNARTEAGVMQRFCPQTPRSNPLALETCKLEVRSQAMHQAEEIRRRTDLALRALRGALEALGTIDGPKALVWIAEGLPIDAPGAMADISTLATRARTSVHVIAIDAPMVNVMEAETSPSGREDRDLERRGLELMASLTGGVLFPTSANPDAVFDRVENELAGYYLLGVESIASDRDGKRHPIKVTVRRQAAEVRARREFQSSSDADARSETTGDRLLRTLKSPFAVTDLSMRLATYAYHEPNGAKVRVAVATEIEREREADATAANATIGILLADATGRIVVNSVRRTTVAPLDGPRGLLLEDVAVLSLDPGTYALKVAAVDDRGRRGSIERPLIVWQMTDVPFATSDLLLGDSPPRSGDPPHPAVEARIASGKLAAYLELYADRSDFFETTEVRVEVATEQSSPALRSGIAPLVVLGDGRTRFMAAIVPMENLPPDQYVARAVVTRGGQIIGQLVRPFRIVDGASALLAPIASMLAAPGPFERDAIIEPDVLRLFMDVLDHGRPALRPATSQVRRGRFGGAARQAFEAGDQLAATFLRGLELLTKDEVNQAATQFTATLRVSPDFWPASFYLGACYAIGGRDREAVTAWRRALAAPDKLPLEYILLSDALFRMGELEQAAAPLREALTAWPSDDPIRRRLAIAESAGQRHAEALAVIEPYLARHATDEEALLVALQAIYAKHVSGRPPAGADEDRERMAGYARAYAALQGPHEAIVARWAAYVARH